MSVMSMTGFARCEGAHGDWSWAVEARSVNGRNLEVRCKGPAGWDNLERIARELAQSRFKRGQISLNVQGRRVQEGRRAQVNAEALDRYLALGEPLIAAGRAGPPSLDGLLALPGVLEFAEAEEDATEREALEAAVTASLAKALDGLKAARLAEGRAIGGVLAGFLDRIESLNGSAEAEAAAQPALIKARFERRLAELLGEAASAERIMQEAAAQAVKADVREELDRLAGHVTAARALLAGGEGAGRRLDFLTQECMREDNTLCSKSAAAALTTVGLELKATIDQLKEQVQNVE